MPAPSAASFGRALAAAALIPTLVAGFISAQSTPLPSARLLRALPIDLPGPVDSNSPALWDDEEGDLHVFTSFAGAIGQSDGPSQFELGPSAPINWRRAAPPGGVWMEAIVADTDTWYGFYHNEVAPPECPDAGKVRPRIGAARSRDRGESWDDLGVILESPEPSLCGTVNKYNVGGVGDFSVMLDQDARYLYLFYSDYAEPLEAQGVSVSRMQWANRDKPAGALAVWTDGLWLPASSSVTGRGRQRRVTWSYPAGTPIYAARRSWHSGDGRTDAFWGPSIHWNTYLEQYVMLLSRANTTAFGSEGIYVAFAGTLADPEAWSAPQRLQPGGAWYPQVLGLSEDEGTDKVAGQRARFFMSGKSLTVIEFSRPERH